MKGKAYTIIKYTLAGTIAALLWAQPLNAQSYLEREVKPAEVDRERWAAAKEGINYGKPEPKQKKEPDQESANRKGGGEREGPQPEAAPTPQPWLGSEAAALLLRIFVWIAVAVFIAVLLRYLLGLKRPPKNNRVQKGASSGADLQAIEEDLPEARLEDFLQEAIKNKEYSLAVRLYYLVLLQGLTHKKLVSWQKDKTNNQYIQELGGTPLQDDFRSVTLLFEQVWYGDQVPDQSTFEAMVPEFQAFAQRIQDLKADYAQ